MNPVSDPPPPDGWTPRPARPAADEALARLAADDHPEAWTLRLPADEVRAAADAVDARRAGGEPVPLAGLTVGVKDNIDVAGHPTTAACAAYADGPVDHDATAVARLRAAGAVVVGKTNLDQFATGLVGTRSPDFGAVASVVAPDRVGGGSSSGSAVAVALGLVDVALGTDTAGSGRVPAAFNEIIGLKPTYGLVPKTGVVPASPSFDTVSVFARAVGVAAAAVGAMAGPDADDPASRPVPPPTLGPRRGQPERPWRLGVPDPAALAMDVEATAAFADHVASLAARLGPLAEFVTVDVGVIEEAGALLYGDALLAERYAAVGAFLDAHPGQVDPTVAAVVGAGRDVPAHRYAAAWQRLLELRREARDRYDDLDAVVLPTAPGHPTLAEVAADPIEVNRALGRFTNGCNLLDRCAVALPGPRTPSGACTGVRLYGPAFTDDTIAALAAAAMGEAPPPPILPAPDDLPVVVVGLHLSGQPLNGQLVERGGRLVAATTTAPHYRLFALPTEPAKPGLVRDEDGGAAIEVEVWRLPAAGFGTFVDGVPLPLAIGRVELADGTWAAGFLALPDGLAGARDITDAGGWRAHLARR